MIKKLVAVVILLSATVISSTAMPGGATGWQDDLAFGKATIDKLKKTDWKNGNYETLAKQNTVSAQGAETRLRTGLSQARAAKAPATAEAALLYELGQTLCWQKRYADANIFFEQAMTLYQKAKPGNTVEKADCLVGLAICLQGAGDNKNCEDKMIDAYEIYLKLLPHEDVRFADVLPVIGAYTDDRAEAVEYYKHLVDVEKKLLGPNHPDLALYMHLYAAALSSNKQHAEAASAYQSVLPLEKSSPDAQSSTRGHLDGEQKIASGAIPDWQDVECVPRYIGRRTRKRQGLSDTQTPLSERERDRVFGPSDQPKQADPGTPYRARPPEEVPRRESSPRKPIGLPDTPDDSVVPRAVPRKTAEAPTRTGHKRFFQSGREISKEEYDALALSNQACDLIAAGRYEQALAKLRAAESLSSSVSSVHCNMGVTLEKLGQRDQAILHLKKAVSIEPDESGPLSLLASAYQGNGMLKEAILAYREYMRRFPDESDITFVRALIRDLENSLAEQQEIEAELNATGKKYPDDYLAYVAHNGKIRWAVDKLPIKIYLARANGVKGFKENYAQILTEAFSEWTTGAGGKLKFAFVNSKDKADVDCYFTDDFSKVGSPAEGGEAQTIYAKNEGFRHCTIVVLTVKGNSDLLPTENEIRAVCLHEIGHTLGLAGHSPNPDDILFCTVPGVDKRPQLTERDLRTLKRLYD